MSSSSDPSSTMSSSPSTNQASSGTSPSSPLSSPPPSSPISGTNSSSLPPTASTRPTSSTPTSDSPTTTPQSTPQSSPAQTSSSPARTTAPASSGSSPTSTAAAVSTSSSFTSQVATTYATTDPGGSIVFITTTMPEVIGTSVGSGSSPSNSSSSSNTGIIVGSVVGGIAGITIIALLLFCIRRRARRDEFDGNFDPDRVVGQTGGGGGTLPRVDLADDVTPFPPSQPYTDQGSMRQYGKSPYIPVPSLGASGHASSEFYPPGSMGVGPSIMDAQQRPSVQSGAVSPPPGAYAPPINMYGTGPSDWHNPRPGASPPPSTVSNTTSSVRMSKEREAMARNGQGPGLGLATQPEVPEGAGSVVVHQDAGRAPIEEHAPPREIPPSYDSIRQD